MGYTKSIPTMGYQKLISTMGKEKSISTMGYQKSISTMGYQSRYQQWATAVDDYHGGLINIGLKDLW